MSCPCCGTSTSVKNKTLLIDAEWIAEPGSDSRIANFASIRVDDVKPEFLQAKPLQQFVEGFYCSACDIGFIPDAYEKPGARCYYLRKTNKHDDKA